jgi:hypothetical protein
MLVIKIELHSAITGKITEIGRMHIFNKGDSIDPKIGNYGVHIFRRGSKSSINRVGYVNGHRRLAKPVWNLVAKALKAVRY